MMVLLIQEKRDAYDVVAKLAQIVCGMNFRYKSVEVKITEVDKPLNSKGGGESNGTRFTGARKHQGRTPVAAVGQHPANGA